MNVTNDVTTTTTTTTNAATTTNSRRLSRLDDVDSTFNDLRDEAEETDIPRSSPSLKSARKRLSDWRFVMNYYESKLDEIEGLQWRDNFNYIARRHIIHEVRKLAPLCKTGSTPTLICVRTVAAKLRKLLKESN